ncbi:MAG TPA: protein-L-isoaspartate(D-aspartate) O-methyltransferase [Bryobacteraceae bacterium]|nr:protein-L-isoaspartate(D-aspartate) O-methyltransferase [Bryobacteraceae bacterium]
MRLLVAAIMALSAAVLPSPQGRERERERMVREQIEARGVQDRAVLEAMRAIPRELFMPPGVRAHAYADSPVPIGHGQTISQPYIVAAMTELLRVTRQDRVLEIGTGSGYQAAVLSRLARHVYSIEIVPELARSAAETLRTTGCENVTVRTGDGYRGWPEEAPFTRVILTAAPPEIPQTLIDQLAAGGRLVAPEGESALDQQLVVIEKGRDGKLTRRSVMGVRFVPMVKTPR